MADHFILVTAFISALVGSAVLVPVIIWICRKFNLYDRIDERKRHKSQVGRLGGIGIIVSFSVVFYFFIKEYIPAGISINILSLSFLLLFLMGLADDLKGLRVRYKLIVQILSSSLAVYAGVSIPVVEAFHIVTEYSAYIDPFLTVIWILAFMNAINLIDGMDGLSSGIVITALVFFAAVGIHSGNSLLVLLSVSLAGSVAGFFIYNFHPAKIFLGDAGAYCLGFILSVLFPVCFHSITSIKVTFVPAVILLIPFIDVAQVVTRRLWLKSGIFNADNNHIHHKLLAAGYGCISVLGIICSIGVIFGCLGVLFWSGNSISCSYILTVTIIFVAILLFKISAIEDRTIKLSSLAEPGFKWWKQNLRFYAENVIISTVSVNGRKKSLVGNVFDLSIDGFFYSTDAVLCPEDRLSIILMFIDRKPLRLTAEVVWVNNKPNSNSLPKGYGCCFVGINALARKKIKYHLISNKAPIRLRVKKEERTASVIRVISGGRVM